MEKAIEQRKTDAVSLARAMIADPFLVKHIKDGGSGPECNFCNGCIARAGGSPIDCYNQELIPHRTAMLNEAGFSVRS